MPDDTESIDEAIADDPSDESGTDTVAFDAEAAPAAEPTADERVAAAEDRALRFQAELQNVLNRTRREVAEERKYGPLGLVRDLLPAIDNIDRALAAAKQAGDEADPSGVAAGFKMVREQLIAVLAQHGCEVIVTEPGTPFDPNQHEAILQQPSDEVDAGAVTMASQTGYKLHDRVVRAAQVIVSSGPAS